MGTCAPANCKTDADCGDFLCASPRLVDPCAAEPVYDFRCQTPEDQCMGNGDCGQGGGSGELTPELCRAPELLSLGAPSELLLATQRALGDEIAHAEACFGLASAYAGRRVGPGPMSIQNVLPRAPSALEVARSAFLEACIGETVAAAEALAALEQATDPAVKAVLKRIAADEGRHAELGWRFLRWIFEEGAPGTRASLARELEDLLEAELARRARAERGSAGQEVLAAHGLLPRAVAESVRDAALRDIVVPCARALGIARVGRAA
jgi:hypothetical protein